MTAQADLSGCRFARLVVVRRVADPRPGGPYWEVTCDCGRTKVVRGAYLKNGVTKSCGCLVADSNKIRRNPRHGHAALRTRTYRIWKGMRARCLREWSISFPHYGGRGISICERWNLFENFLADMGEAPDGLTLDRFPDNAGNYEPTNCRWATMKEQQRNRSDNRLLTHAGETMCLAAWAERYGVEKSLLRWRIEHGWPLARAFNEGPQRKAMEIQHA